MGDKAPKALHCLHTLCLGCLAQAEEQGTAVCTKCGLSTPIPPRGAHGLKDSYPALSLMTTARERLANESSLGTDSSGDLGAAEARHEWGSRIAEATARLERDVLEAQVSYCERESSLSAI